MTEKKILQISPQVTAIFSIQIKNWEVEVKTKQSDAKEGKLS